MKNLVLLLIVILSILKINAQEKKLALGVTGGGLYYESATSDMSGGYLYFGGQGVYKFSKSLSGIVIATFETGIDSISGWGPSLVVGVETPISKLIFDVTFLVAKDVGPKPGPWVYGPGFVILTPIGDGVIGPTFQYTISDGENFYNIGATIFASL